MTQHLPSPFLQRLETIIPSQQYDKVLQSFSEPAPLSVRINTLKTTKEKLTDILRQRNIVFEDVPWAEEALIFKGITRARLGQMDIVADGLVYRQGISSMLPVIILDPKPGEQILDMCAAPGSKTAQMAARMDNRGEITAIEAIRGRYYKLRSVMKLSGATNVSFKLMDARRFRPGDRVFDKILVDAPCSSEGRFKDGEPKTFAYWSPRKIKEMARKQRGLLLTAGRLLRPGGVLVYATCTFAPEENEGVVQWLLKKTEGALGIEHVNIQGAASYPAVTAWQGKVFGEDVRKCLRVLPGEGMEGFFVAKFHKRNKRNH
jgi:NOL1/NOP2/sun family putative RNA methylase